MNTITDTRRYKLSLIQALLVASYFMFKYELLNFRIDSILRRYIIIFASLFMIVFSLYIIFLHVRKIFKNYKQMRVLDCILTIYSTLFSAYLIYTFLIYTFFISIIMISDF